MGGHLSTDRGTDTLCTQEWDKYLNSTGKPKDDWELLLDDSRNVNLHDDTSKFLARFTDIMENLFLGCKEVMSARVHQEFSDVTVKRMEELINFDHSNNTEKKFNKVVRLIRLTEDSDFQRKTEMILVMVIRITVVAKKRSQEQEEEQPTFQIENSIKVQIRSIKDPSLQPESPELSADCGF